MLRIRMVPCLFRAAMRPGGSFMSVTCPRGSIFIVNGFLTKASMREANSTAIPWGGPLASESYSKLWLSAGGETRICSRSMVCVTEATPWGSTASIFWVKASLTVTLKVTEGTLLGKRISCDWVCSTVNRRICPGVNFQRRAFCAWAGPLPATTTAAVNAMILHDVRKRFDIVFAPFSLALVIAGPSGGLASSSPRLCPPAYSALGAGFDASGRYCGSLRRS